ncbi:MAG: hypothetical protein JWO38_6518, partial [Gemmataceae bacterium]|nr:hypothetical protein [Gemmataceae bacterium]
MEELDGTGGAIPDPDPGPGLGPRADAGPGRRDERSVGRFAAGDRLGGNRVLGGHLLNDQQFAAEDVPF